MSLRKVTSLGSNLASVTDLKELKLHTVYAEISEAIKEVVAVQSRAHRFAKSFYHSFVSEQKYDIGTKPHVPNRILCKGLYQRPVRGKGVCSHSNRTAQRLQMATRKSL